MSKTSKIQLRLNPRELFVVACLAGSLVSAISVSFVKSICSDCADASGLAPLGLNVIGALFYGALLIAIFRIGLTSKVAAVVTFASAFQLSLSVMLAIKQLACIPCIVTSVLVVSAGVAVIPKLSRRSLVVWGGFGILVCSAALFAQWFWTRTELQNKTRMAIGFSTWPKQSSGPIVITVFYSDKCKKCIVYKREILTKAEQKFGNDISIKYCSNPAPMTVPTTVVGGEEPILLIGKPSWDALSGAIEKNIAKRR